MPETLPLNAEISVELGYAALKQDEELIFNTMYQEDPLLVEDAEFLARCYPESQFKIILADAAAVKHFERTAPDTWILTRQDPGIWSERTDEL